MVHYELIYDDDLHEYSVWVCEHILFGVLETRPLQNKRSIITSEEISTKHEGYKCPRA